MSSSLFDDDIPLPGFDDAGAPPPPDEQHYEEQLPAELFAGAFDTVPEQHGRDAHYRDGAPRPVVDPDRLLDGMNPQQREAVLHEGSPLLIVAGAGSGKTRVLTHRIAYLLAARDVAPQEILAITFTNKAAGEMAARVAALVGPQARSMWVMTFHSACVRILRREARRFGYPSSFSIYDQADSQRLMA